MDLGLGRISALLRRVGSPQSCFPVIHVAGTNGKGSTVAYLDAFLTHAVGVRAARFVSPHLMHARDSVRVAGGEPIDERTWELARRCVQEADAVGSEDAASINATPFELLTAQALVSFTLLPAAARPDVLVVEVGVGGVSMQQMCSPKATCWRASSVLSHETTSSSSATVSLRSRGKKPA